MAGSVPLTGATYGYGWCLAEVAGQRLRFHPGDNAGFASLNISLPDRDAVMVLLSNDENGDLRKLSRRLLGDLANRPAQ